jgi:TRAP-type C4-dicarboxylate transport system permease small subunit
VAKANSFTKSFLMALAMLLIIAATAYLCYFARHYAHQRASLKNQYSEVNDIRRGLMNVNLWRGQLKIILQNEIENFDFTPKQDSILRQQVDETLHRLINEARAQIKRDDKTLGKRIRNFAIETVVNWDKIEDRVPSFTNKIMAELYRDKTKGRLKMVATQKMEEYADQIYRDSDSALIANIYNQNEVTNKAAFNKVIYQKIGPLQYNAYQNTYAVLALLLITLLPWFFLKKDRYLQIIYFTACTLLALVVLLAGLSSPMIEIDARLATMEFTLLGQDLIFRNQMLFYRSKSIIEMVQILLATSKADSIFVGILIMAFSVLLPVCKLVATQIYMHGKPRWQDNKVLAWLALKSGKWSMADVMVVAIFMAFVGFDGILDSQLQNMNYNNDNLHSLSTNQTALQPGFLLFLGFVLYGLILAAILKKVAVTKKSV